MSLDPDIVRVDLIKVKHKLYNSFPEGSKERADFLLASKLSEINYLSKLVPQEVANLVFEGHKKYIKDKYISIILNISIGLSASLMLYGFHSLYFPGVPQYLTAFPFAIGLAASISHMLSILEEYRKMKPFKDEFLYLQNRLQKLRNELKDLK